MTNSHLQPEVRNYALVLIISYRRSSGQKGATTDCEG